MTPSKQTSVKIGNVTKAEARRIISRLLREPSTDCKTAVRLLTMLDHYSKWTRKSRKAASEDDGALSPTEYQRRLPNRMGLSELDKMVLEAEAAERDKKRLSELLETKG